jgi:hypothetical protein
MCGQLYEYITEKALGKLMLQLQDIQVRQTADSILCEQERVVHLYLRKGRSPLSSKQHKVQIREVAGNFHSASTIFATPDTHIVR